MKSKEIIDPGLGERFSKIRNQIKKRLLMSRRFYISEESAEDVAQEAIARGLKALGTDGRLETMTEQDLGAFMNTVAHSVFCDFIKKENREKSNHYSAPARSIQNHADGKSSGDECLEADENGAGDQGGQEDDSHPEPIGRMPVGGRVLGEDLAIFAARFPDASDCVLLRQFMKFLEKDGDSDVLLLARSLLDFTLDTAGIKWDEKKAHAIEERLRRKVKKWGCEDPPSVRNPDLLKKLK